MCQIKEYYEEYRKEPFNQKFKYYLSLLSKPKLFLFVTSVKINKKYKMFTPSSSGKQGKLFSKKEEVKNSAHSSHYTLKPGDIVRVRSKEEIRQTLDKKNKLDGCFFMDEMWQYCGTQQRVLRRVEGFFDEAGLRMFKTRDIVLLEGLNCSGKVSYFETRCDRFCYYFWKEAWLEKIEDSRDK
ncbi:MAG: hypothetical protein ACOC6D_04790 [Atribacterota bacterium]